jgi:hypothetical protein
MTAAPQKISKTTSWWKNTSTRHQSTLKQEQLTTHQQE